MWKIFSSSLTRRVIFQVTLLALILLATLVYISLDSTTKALKEEVQLRVNQQGESLALIMTDYLEKTSFDLESFALNESVAAAAKVLTEREEIASVRDLPEHQSLRQKLQQEKEVRNLSFIAVVDERQRVLASANTDQVGQKLILDGLVDSALKKGAPAEAFSVITREELEKEDSQLAEETAVKRIPTQYQKTGWREGTEERDGLVLAAVVVLKNESQIIGAVVSGIILNGNSEILNRVVEKSGGIATINFYDDRIATTLNIGDKGEKAVGTLLSEEVVNSVYISQKEYFGRAFEVNSWYLMAYLPLKNHEQEAVGSVARGVPESEIQSKIAGLRQRYIIVGIIVFVVVYFVTSLVTRQIVNALKKLAANAYRISRGNLEIDIQAPQRDDEIGDLTHSFIIMKDKLLEYYTKLEDLVAQRTKELRQKVKDLEQARHRIEEEKNKSDSVLQNVGDGVLALDNKLSFIACNEAAGSLLEISPAEIIGNGLREIISLKNLKLTETNKNFDPITEAINTGQVIATGTGEFAVVTKSKREVPVTITAAPLKDNNGAIHGGVVVIKDVTKEQEIDKMKSEFVSVASHQLRTPLSASKWFLEMVINGDAGKLNDEQKEYLDHSYKSNERMIDLVNDLLNVSRIESGTIAIEPIETDLDGMIRSVLFELTPQVKQRKIKTAFTTLPGGSPKIKIDPKLIRQVFQNLLSNAVKYTPENGSVAIKITKEEKYLQFEISDTGVGIPKAQQPKVFKKFFRADNVITMQTEGTGLGLYVAKSVVDASGGKIWFKSIENKGTSFFFTLPLAGSKRREGEKTLI